MWCLGPVNLLVVNSRWDSWSGGDPVLQFSPPPGSLDGELPDRFLLRDCSAVVVVRRTFIATPDARRVNPDSGGSLLRPAPLRSLLLAVSK